MTCAPGCLRKPLHSGFCTTIPALAKYEDERTRPVVERVQKMVKDAFVWAKEQEDRQIRGCFAARPMPGEFL